MSWQNRHKLQKRARLNSKYQGHGQLNKAGRRANSGLKRAMPAIVVGRGSKVKTLPSGVKLVSRRTIARKPAISAAHQLAQLSKNMSRMNEVKKPAKLASATDVFTFAQNIGALFIWE